MSQKYINTVLRNFYAPGYSYITVAYFNTNLSLRFYRYIGKHNKNGFDQDIYDLPNGMTTTVNYEGASYLHQAAMSILKDINSEKEIGAVLQCNKAALILECKSDQGNQMAAYLVIEKNNQSIPFKFITHTVQVKENGQTVTKVVQSGLGAFAKTIEGYLIDIGASLHLSKLPDNFENSPDEDQQTSNTTTVNNGYQQGNYNSYSQYAAR
ncbi:MAG: hypothetical protein LBJ71_04935 [Holosporaceae bacterium]|jgi:hypothetical protein|nr:hypothetical protein [Holosporaceae bacterium]